MTGDCPGVTGAVSGARPIFLVPHGMPYHPECWSRVEEQWRAARRAATLARIRLDGLLERAAQAKAVLRSASDLYVSAKLARRHALLSGDMARFQRATDGVKKALGRETWASDSLSTLRPEIEIAGARADRLDDEADRWEELYWHCTAGWLLDLWSTELRALVSAEQLLDCYRAFGLEVREEIEAEVDVFAKTVRRLTENR